MELKKLAAWLRRVHLRDRLVEAGELQDETCQWEVLQIIKKEEQQLIWHQINRVTDQPRVGIITHMQRQEDEAMVNYAALMRWP